jgi:hypothetical protein
MNNRLKAEVNSLFGQAVVNEAITHSDFLENWENASIENRFAVIRAIQRLRQLTDNPIKAVSYVASLPNEVKGCLVLTCLKKLIK